MPLKNGDVERLYCECRQQLFTCALTITHSAVRAEDAVHDAFCRVLGSNHAPDDLKAYVFRAVRNAAIDQVRRHELRGEPLPDFIFEPAAEPDNAIECADFQRRVVKEMRQLSDDERETIVQHLYGDLTFQQIATVRDVPLGTVVSWYRRGVEKLRRKMETVDGPV